MTSSYTPVGPGQVSSGVVLGIGDGENVYGGGIAVATQVGQFGLEEVYSGGTDLRANVGSGGELVLFSGGTGYGETIASGGSLYLVSGAVASGATYSGAFLFIDSGYALSGGTVSSDGVRYLTVKDGSTAVNTLVAAGGSLELGPGTAASGISIVSTGDVFAQPGASLVGIQVSQGASIQLGSGTTVTGALAENGAVVLYGATAVGTVLSSGGTLAVGLGTASGTVVQGGGTEVVLADGQASGTVVGSGGTEIDQYGRSGRLGIGSVVLAGGTLVGKGPDDVVARSGAPGYPLSGNVTFGARLEGGTLVLSAGAGAVATQVGSGGTLVVLSGGTMADDTAVAAGGALDVLSGAVIAHPGSGDATTVAVSSGVGSGQVAGGTLGSGTAEFVFAGGTASGTTVAAGGFENLVGGLDSGAQVGSGGILAVAAGGTALGAAVASGGVIEAYGAASLDGTAFNGGTEVIGGGYVLDGAAQASPAALLVLSGATASAVAVSGSETVSAGGLALDTRLTGIEAVLSGGAARATAVAGGGTELVSAGGTATGTTVGVGGSQVVRGTAVAARLDGGSQVVSSSGVAGGTVVGLGGVASVLSGATISGAVVGSGGTLVVSAGGLLIGATVAAGGTLDTKPGALVVSAGPPGTGFAVLAGSHDEYTVYASGDGSAGTVQDGVAGRDGSVGLSGPTNLLFADGDGLFDPTGQAGEVARLYVAALGRTADLNGLDYWTGQLNAGSLGLPDVAASLVTSPEFAARYGALSDADYVQQLYGNVLGRAGDAGGVGFWTGALAAGASRASVLIGFSDSAENKANTLSTTDDRDTGEAYRLYQAAFDRAPDAAGLSYWTGALDAGATPLQVAQGFTGTPEYAATYAGDDATGFVTQLYANVLHRAPDPSGEQYWVGQLADGAGQAGVLLGFSDSAENRSATAAATHDNWVFLGSAGVG